MTMSGAGFIDSELRSIMNYIKTRMLMFYLNVVLWIVVEIGWYRCVCQSSCCLEIVSGCIRVEEHFRWKLEKKIRKSIKPFIKKEK